MGLRPRRQRVCRPADGKTIQRNVGYGVLVTEGFETTDEIVFGPPGDCPLLGVRTLPGFGVTVDPQRVATLTLAASGLRLR